MNALLNTDALKSWTGYNNLRDLTRFLNRMKIPYANCGETHIVSTLASVQTAFDAKEVNESVEIIRVDEVMKLTKLSRSTIHLHTKKEQFPSSKQLGPKSVGWYKKDVLQWLDGKRDWQH